MDPSSTHHQEMMGSDQQSLESILVGPTKSQQEAASKKPKPPHEQALKCPRCESTNTKFCYYNNYSLSQPRYFCKSCRRYWTKGGTLRNVPVGGGCRKSKRPSSSKRITITSAHQDHLDYQHSLQLQDLIALNSNSNPLTGIHNLAYEASYPGENFHLPLTFADQLHKLSNGQLDGHDSPMHQGFLEAPSANNLQGLYFGLGDGANREINTEGVMNAELMLPYGETKPDFCSGESRVLWGCPWPINGDGISNSGDLSSIRGSWNNVGFSSSWHGLLNSPLM